MLRLILQEDGREKVLEFEEEIVSVGRTAENEIRISEPKASRKHCIIYYSAKGYILEDLKSRNGTRLNGKPVDSELLSVGDVIEIGATRLHFGEKSDSSAESRTRKKSTSKRTAKASGRSKKGGNQILLLQALSGENKGRAYQISRLPFTIGSGSDNVLTVDAPGVKEHHVEIIKKGDGLTLVALDEEAGTQVDGKVAGRVVLRSGATIEIGEKTVFRFLVKRPGQKSGRKKRTSARASASAESKRTKKKSREPADPAPEPEPVDEAFAQDELALEPIDAERALEEGAGGGGNLVALLGAGLVIGGILVVGYLLIPLLLERPELSPSPAGNLVENWSFEEADPTGALVDWEGPGIQEKKEHRGGNRSLRLAGSSEGVTETLSPETLADSERDYRLHGYVRMDGAELAGFRVIWSRSDDPERRIVSYAPPVAASRSGWVAVKGWFTPPIGVDRVRVGCFVVGGGEALFDQVQLQSADPRERRPLELVADGDVAGVVRHHGRVDLYRGTELVFHRGELFRGNDWASVLGGQDLEPSPGHVRLKAEAVHYASSIRSADGRWIEYVEQLDRDEGRLRLRYRFESLEKGPVGFTFLTPYLGEFSGEAIVGEERKPITGEDRIVGVQEVIWGSGANLVSYTFHQPITLSVAPEGNDHRVEFLFDGLESTAEGETRLTIRIASTSKSETEAVTAELRKARSLEEAGSLQAARERYHRISRNREVAEAIQEQAKKEEERLDRLVRTWVEDLEKLRDTIDELRAEALLSLGYSRCDRLIKAFPGTPEADRAKTIKVELEKLSDKFSGGSEADEAERLLARAQDRLEEKRYAVARALYEEVIRRYPNEKDAAKRARDRLTFIEEQVR